LRSFAYTPDRLPSSLTRLQAVTVGIPDGTPAVVMDTGVVAVLGALEDSHVRAGDNALIVNVGNFHTLAFHLVERRVRALFEHHTGLLEDRAKLEGYLTALANGSLTNEAIFADSGHGALQIAPPNGTPRVVAVTGPRRRILTGSTLRPYFAVPHGDMMLCGCFGLLRGLAAALPQFAETVDGAMGPLA
jgi:uncharacterized protein (DUF1786 family)